jgi:hypothetical protein
MWELDYVAKANYSYCDLGCTSRRFVVRIPEYTIPELLLYSVYPSYVSMRLISESCLGFSFHTISIAVTNVSL